MTHTEVSNKAELYAWQGWIRSGSGFRAAPAIEPNRLELGAAVFSLPDPREANTTSWALSDGVFSVFSGFLYNRRDLARQLECDAEAASPAEVVLVAFDRWGEVLAQRLDGAFAWAVWNASEESLLAGRDIVGMYPFFYSRVGDELVFSWDFETVRRHPRVPKELNRIVLAEHLVHKLSAVDETFFRGICRLPGGHRLKFRRGRLEVVRYWDPIPPRGPVKWVNREELSLFPDLLRQSVENAMESAGGQGGIFLSGGIDSVSVAMCAREIAAARKWATPRAFSIIFPGHACEEPTQKGVAEELGLPQTFDHIIRYREGPGLLRRALDAAALNSAPATFVFAPPFVELLKQARAQGCQFVLTGDGGDELLTVSLALSADLIRSGDWGTLYRQLRALLRYWEGSSLRAFRSLLWTWGFRTLLRDWVWRRAPGLAMQRRRQLLAKAIPPWVAPDRVLRCELVRRYEEQWDRLTSQGSVYLTYLDAYLVDPRVNMVFEEQFYRNALVGIPTLHPYWNRPLADFLLRTPPQILNSGDQTKGLVRPMVASRFPQYGFATQKKMIATEFPKQALQEELPALWRGLGRPRQMAELGLVEPGPYESMLAGLMAAKRTNQLYQAWHGATIEDWIRLHG